MSFGSDTEGGSPEGIGGNESDIGGSSGGSEGSSYSQEAMNSALAASIQQMTDYGGYGGLGIGNPGSYGGSNNIGGGSPGGTSQEVADALNMAMTINNRRNTIHDAKETGFLGTLGNYATSEPGTLSDWQRQALGEMGVEWGLNKAGGITGGALGTAVGGPALGLAGSQLLGKAGTLAVDMGVQQKIAQDLGLVDRVTGPNPGALSKEQTDGLIKRLMDRRV